MILIRDIKELVGILDKPHSFKKGEALSIVESLKDAFLLIDGEVIKDFGPMNQCPKKQNFDEVISAKGQLVLPSWCDSHTHIVYADSREGEYVQRIEGKSYEEIASAGGGILNSAQKLQATPFGELYDSAAQRLEEVMSLGTGLIEIKSGYGLSFESEVKMLSVIQKLNESYPIDIKSTFLGAHAIPKKYQSNRPEYISLLTEKMIPYVADQGLAQYCDVFCDKGFYTVDETDTILTAAAKYGLKAKIHANELGITGGVQIGIKHNAISVDHLECTGDEEIEALLASDTIPTLLPGTSYFLNIPYAPARKMIDAGLGVCLATDYNPGSTPSGNIPFLMSLACTKMKMLPKEAFNAVTINGAYAIEEDVMYGSITKGKYANLIVTKPIKNLDYISYAYGGNHISKVFLKGKIL